MVECVRCAYINKRKNKKGVFLMKGNVLVGQSGGPTAVINSSLAGVYKTAMERGFTRVYGMRWQLKAWG